MTLTSKQPLECDNPRCVRMVEQPLRGRPRRYCEDRCGVAARAQRAKGTRLPRERTAIHRAYATDIATATWLESDWLLNLYSQPVEYVDPDALREEALEALQRLQLLGRMVDDFAIVAAQVARDAGATTSEIAENTWSSVSKVSRKWPDSPHAIDRAIAAHRQRREATAC